MPKNWERYALALDLHLSGLDLKQIGDIFGVSKERARQLIQFAKAQLAFRVFKGLKRPASRIK